MRYRIAEPPEEVANWIACGRTPADKRRSYEQDQNDSLEQKPHKCCNSAPHGALFNISSAFPVGMVSGRVGTPQRVVPTSQTKRSAFGFVFVRLHDLALLDIAVSHILRRNAPHEFLSLACFSFF
jgi:hypothetical protein